MTLIKFNVYDKILVVHLVLNNNNVILFSWKKNIVAKNVTYTSLSSSDT